MKTSPLRLDDAFICEIELKSSRPPEDSTSDRYVAARVDANPTYSQFLSDPLKWKVELDVSFGRSEESIVPYEGRVAVRGFFTLLDEAMTPEVQRKVVAVNCPSILYATAREAVASLTGRGEYGRLLLPSISFIDQLISPPEEEALKAPEPEEQPSIPDEGQE